MRLRERARQAVDEERRRRASALHAAQQRLGTQARREMQTRRSEMVQHAWPALITAMQSRWSAQASRSDWCEMLLSEAAQFLPAESWLIEHPPTWRDADTRRLTKSLRDRRLPEAKFRAASDICAGLRIRHGGVCLDGTIDGLLSRRREVQARLIAAWLRRKRAAEDRPHG